MKCFSSGTQVENVDSVDEKMDFERKEEQRRADDLFFVVNMKHGNMY